MKKMLQTGSGRLALAAAELHRPRTLALAAMLAALNLALNQFTIPVSAYLEISFDFLASAAAEGTRYKTI